MKFDRPSKLAALALSLGVLAGCGQGAPLGATLSDPGKLLNAENGQQGQAGDRHGHGGMRGKGGFGGLFAGITLSEDQKAQLKALAEKYKPARPGGERPFAKIKELLEADTVDAAALRAALANPPAPPSEDNHLAFMKEARAILTDAQRAEAIAKLKAMPNPPARPAHAPRPEPTAEEKQQRLNQLAEKLKLNDEQKSALVAFTAKMEANRPATFNRPAPGAFRDALVSFLENGDTTGLEALKPRAADRPPFPVEEFVTLATSLNKEQRKALLMMGFGGRGHHGRGGKGGFGRHGRPGEQGDTRPAGFFGGNPASAPSQPAR